jgi:hypothetical protein
VQAGARFAAQLSTSSDRSVCTLSDLEPNGRRAGSVIVYVGGIGRTLDHEASAVHDVTRVVATAPAQLDEQFTSEERFAAATDERFAALYDTLDGETMLLEVANETVDISLLRPVPRGVRRVVASSERWYVASDAEVHVITHRTAAALDLIAVDAIDLAVARVAGGGRGDGRGRGARAMLCVVDARGLTWFDHDGAVINRRAVGSPTAIVGDALAGGWLVAADGDVLQFASPSSSPVVLARDVGLVTRLRRDVDALYASLETGELVEVRGIRHGATDSKPRTIAAFARGFTEFDAAFALFVDDGGGPRRFADET